MDPNEVCQLAWNQLELAGYPRGTKKRPGNNKVRPGYILSALRALSLKDGDPNVAVTGYNGYVVPITGEVNYVQSPDPRVAASTVFSIPRPDPEVALWTDLSGHERLEMARLIENEFANTLFGFDILHRYLKEGMYGPTYKKFYGRLKGPEDVEVDGRSPRFQLPEEALASGDVALSPYRFLHAALSGQPVGLCQQVTCAKLGLLSGIGMPPQWGRVAWGKVSKRIPLFHHYATVLPKRPGRGFWYPIDGTPMYPIGLQLRDGRTRASRDGYSWRDKFEHGFGDDLEFLVPKPAQGRPRLPEDGRFEENGDYELPGEN